MMKSIDRIGVVLSLSLLLPLASGCLFGDDDDDTSNNNNKPPRTCGDGLLQGLEECDNGIANSDLLPDACRTDCLPARCGDMVTDTGEQCDDGRYNSDLIPDVCRPGCNPPACGDGVVDVRSGESCDDGNTIDGDGCSSVCIAEYCGNGVVEAWELCDDANVVVGDGCTPDCRSAEECGNGVLDYAVGETCDCGTDGANLPIGCSEPNGVGGSPCDIDCQSIYCGNSVLDGNEVCDDGNTVPGDGCSSDCLSDETCGNGRPDFQVGETCDCGTDPANLPPGCRAPNGDPGGACSASCRTKYCGNGLVEAPDGEVCDDGNTVSGDGCSADCRSDETCGNGHVDPLAGELCDDGNSDDTDDCTNNCTLPTCGDGVLDDGEVCDDGNNISGDGCNDRCSSAEICGNGIFDPAAGEQCDDGNPFPGDECNPNCVLPFCGNLVVEPGRGEQCDDGNRVSGDGCSSDCQSDEQCGNGYVDVAVGEMCDDGNLNAGDGCSGCQVEPYWSCSYQPSQCDGLCGDGVIVGTEQCDTANLGGADCTTVGYTSGALGCDGACRYDVSSCI
ncbi:MAG: DUF4215 domain-containing protein [bacterium]